MTLPPLALYVHMPWCVKKCPYCDFNSHGLRAAPPPYADYVAALLADLAGDCTDFAAALGGRRITSVFFGGGTPSLFAPDLIARFLDGARARIDFAADAEITLEANPGTLEHGRFEGYLAAGVNRLSLGVQSFDDEALARLGRIHSSAEAVRAFKSAKDAGFARINLDLMYALPRQTLAGALRDVEAAIALAPEHISHYQLTLEPNTLFAIKPPPLPSSDAAWDMQEACQAELAQAGYLQYEVSAYARAGGACRHNLNYWTFGDYLGIGAGAHGKVSMPTGAALAVLRRHKKRVPDSYLKARDQASRIAGDTVVPESERAFEYMLNALRLIDGTPLEEFTRRTGLALATIEPQLEAARARGWLVRDPERLKASVLGQRFLNDVIELFMPDAPQARGSVRQAR